MRLVGVRHLDDEGRLVVPQAVRKLLGIAAGDALEMSVEGRDVVLSKYGPRCLFCGSETGLTRYRQRTVCTRCLRELASARGSMPHSEQAAG